VDNNQNNYLPNPYSNARTHTYLMSTAGTWQNGWNKEEQDRHVISGFVGGVATSLHNRHLNDLLREDIEVTELESSIFASTALFCFYGTVSECVAIAITGLKTCRDRLRSFQFHRVINLQALAASHLCQYLIVNASTNSMHSHSSLLALTHECNFHRSLW
jgi:hypothetical protein